MKNAKVPKLDWKRIGVLIKLALEEDIGPGDATSVSVIPKNLTARAVLICREDCVCAGLPVAEAVFRAINKNIKVTPKVREGQRCRKNTVMAAVVGNARSLLTAERTVLNFFQRLCGVATISAKFADAAKGSETEILDTRKTTPGWRNLEKYAVAVGGASNHRIGLYDRIMVKDNHRELAGLEGPGGIRRSVEKARTAYPELEVEVEADSLEEVREAADAGADYILLDNMNNQMMAKAVKINAGRARLEASGGITLERVPSIAGLGVDYISAGALTHSAKSIDISMDISV